MGDRTVLVVGAGISGLAAAVSLLDEPDLDVEVWESADRVGGKLATSAFAGVEHVDEGADAYLTRVPHAVAFADRVGVRDLATPTDATAAVWHDRLHEIPGGIVLGLPAELRPFATTSLLSWRGKARAAIEPLMPRRDPDDSLGRLIRQRFGDEVHERLVDALVGSIYATDTDHASLAAIPQIAAVAARHRSLLVGARAARRSARTAMPGPIFAAPASGMAALADAAADDIRRRGGVIRLDTRLAELERDGEGWRADGRRFDAVVLAIPPGATARLLTDTAPDAARLLASIQYADVIMVRLAVPAWPERLHGRSGYLVPKPDQRYVTAASFGSQKWAHWRPPDGSQIIRASLGRDGLPVRHLDDDAAVEAAVGDLARHLGCDLQPTAHSVTRWLDGFPQYRPHHHRLVAAAERALPPALALAGAGYRGIGVPACIADGQRAAAAVAVAVGEGRPDRPIGS